VAANEAYVHHSIWVVDTHHQTVPVACDVEHDPVAGALALAWRRLIASGDVQSAARASVYQAFSGSSACGVCRQNSRSVRFAMILTPWASLPEWDHERKRRSWPLIPE
jgi:hypothetical protein